MTIKNVLLFTTGPVTSPVPYTREVEKLYQNPFASYLPFAMY